MRRAGVSHREATIPDPTIRRLRTEELSSAEIAALRDLLWSAFAAADESFEEHDWEHAIGGTHVLLEEDGLIVAHASVVERAIHIGEKSLRTGYVEAVATAPDRQGRGLGTLVMREMGRIIHDGYQLGVLGTGVHRFYERLGWRTWPGEAYVRTPSGRERTPEEDGHIMVLRTPRTPRLRDGDPISCDWRPGDAW